MLHAVPCPFTIILTRNEPRWGPLVMRGVSLVGVSQSEVGINSNSNSSTRSPQRAHGHGAVEASDPC